MRKNAFWICALLLINILGLLSGRGGWQLIRDSEVKVTNAPRLTSENWDEDEYRVSVPASGLTNGVRVAVHHKVISVERWVLAIGNLFICSMWMLETFLRTRLKKKRERSELKNRDVQSDSALSD